MLAALATEGPAELASAVDQVLGARSEPQLHAEIHRGWLVGYTHRAPNPMTEAWVEQLADGLPASHRDPGTPAGRWADTIRRTLERPDSDQTTAAHVASVEVDRRDGDAVGQWLDPDVFLRLLIRGASLGEPSVAGHRIRARFQT